VLSPDGAAVPAVVGSDDFSSLPQAANSAANDSTEPPTTMFLRVNIGMPTSDGLGERVIFPDMVPPGERIPLLV